ncbi:MAG: DUF3267 domain-containing protein [Anaerolineaceae bacterium]|nr:DUF3267 domain-containing protein [Anaerolineaceae bacterium]
MSESAEPEFWPENGRLPATKTLPPAFTKFHSLDLTNRKLIIAMNMVGLLLLFIFGWLFMGVAAFLNPEFFWLELRIFVATLTLPAFLLTVAVVVVLHELSHALFFWLFSRERPKIGFNLLYAYAAAPDWYFPRRQFVLIGLAPVLLLSLVGVVTLPLVDFFMAVRLILALTVNAAGAVGDFTAVIWALGQPADILLRDEGTAVTAYKSSCQAN